MNEYRLATKSLQQMKKLLLLILLCHTAWTYGQNIWTVSPNPNASTDFHSIGEAMDSQDVEAGDILQVHGGEYGSDTITKPVTIIGPGYYHAENGIAASTTATQLGTITITEGVEGVTFISVIVNGNINVYSNSLYLVRVKTGYINFLGLENKYLYVDKSIISSSIRCLDGDGLLSAEIRNSVYSSINANDVNNAMITNSIITSPSNNGVVGIANSTLSNCIILNSWVFNTSSSYNYCVFLIGSPPTNFPIGTNYFGADFTTLFEGPDNNSLDGQYRLGANSDAIGRGAGGTDCGIFGGNDPYILSGLPPIPLIYEINMPSTSTGTLNVNLKVKSNQ